MQLKGVVREGEERERDRERGREWGGRLDKRAMERKESDGEREASYKQGEETERHATKESGAGCPPLVRQRGRDKASSIRFSFVLQDRTTILLELRMRDTAHCSRSPVPIDLNCNENMPCPL